MTVSIDFISEGSLSSDVILALYNKTYAPEIMVQCFMSDVDLYPARQKVNKEIFKLARRGNDGWKLTRFHFCAITSDWAKETYPDAMYEMYIAITTLEPKPDQSHVLILYFK